MKRQITIALIIMAILLTIMAFSGCAGYNCTLESTPTGMVGKSNRRNIEASKTIDKDGNVTMTYSSKKGAGTLDNIITILSLGLIKR